MNLLRLFRAKPQPVHAPSPVPEWLVAVRTLPSNQLARNIDWLYPTPKAKEVLLKEVEGLRLAISMMGLDPAKVVECLSPEENYTYNCIMFSSLRLDDQALIRNGAANEKGVKAYKQVFENLKYDSPVAPARPESRK